MGPPQNNANTEDDHPALNVPGVDFFFKNGINQRSRCDYHQHKCLNRTYPAAVFKAADDSLVHFLSCKTTHNASQRQHGGKHFVKSEIMLCP